MPPGLWARTPAYPSARKRDVVAAGVEGAAPSIRPPRIRLIEFVMFRAEANTRTSAVSPRLRGPAVLRDLTIHRLMTATATRVSGFELYYSEDPDLTGEGAPILPPLSGTPILEQFVSPAFVARQRSAQSWLLRQALEDTARTITAPLRYLVPLEEFFLKASILTDDTAGALSLTAELVVYEDVDPELIAALLQ